MSDKEVSRQEPCKPRIDSKRNSDTLESSTAFEALSNENNKIYRTSPRFRDSRKHSPKTVKCLETGNTEAESKRKHVSCKLTKSDVQTQSTTAINPSYASSTTSGTKSSSTTSGTNLSNPSCRTPVDRPQNDRNYASIEEKCPDSNSDETSQDSTDESSCVSSTSIAESESTVLENSLQPEADAVREERRIIRRRIRHKYSGKYIHARDQCSDGDESTVDLVEESEQSSS